MLQKMLELSKVCTENHHQRIFMELRCVLQFSKFNGNKYDDQISACITYLYNKYQKTGAITFADVSHVEKELYFLSPLIKKIECLCIGHAHLDMNWLWGYDESVDIVCSTIETMLNLLKRYPTFTYAQSQACIYEILAKYRVDLLKRVKKYIKEGRFEVTAGAWVETDKNLPNGQSLISQIYESRTYLSKILDLPDNYFTIDFQPDTFGHSIDTSEILANSGIKYYYHCRGNENDAITRWQSKSGKQILVYREPKWYNSNIDHHSFDHVIDFAYTHKIAKVLKVFGVGDHGGGATIQDIENILLYATYPLMPTIKFGTFHEYFKYLDKFDHWPISRNEANFIFRGCYSSQSEIKQANSNAETRISNAGLFQVFANCKQDFELLKEAERKVLFNQFHDILPGSGKKETKYYAMAMYQEANALTSTIISKALNILKSHIDTSKIYNNSLIDKKDISYGAGNGYHCKDGYFINSSSYNKQRGYVIFNPTNFKGDKIVSLDLWDYQDDIKNIEAYDDNGQILPLYIQETKELYWSHNVYHCFVKINLKPYSYALLILKDKKEINIDVSYPPMFERVENKDELSLENDYFKAQFNNHLDLISLFDKEKKIEFINKPSNFRFSLEDGGKLMSAWVSGRIDQTVPLNRNIQIIAINKNNLYQEIKYEVKFGQESKFNVTYRLNSTDKYIQIHGDCLLFEKGEYGKTIPRIDYTIYPKEDFNVKYLSQLSSIIRLKDAQDVISQQGCFIQSNNLNEGILFSGKGKYGFNSDDEKVSMVLFRCSFDPDIIPEYGERNFDLLIGTCKNDDLTIRNEINNFLSQPIATTIAYQKGTNESKTYLQISDNLNLIDAYIDRLGTHLVIANHEGNKSSGYITLNTLEINKVVTWPKLDPLDHNKHQISINIDANSFVHLIIN